MGGAAAPMADDEDGVIPGREFPYSGIDEYSLICPERHINEVYDP
jgi:hypothetical protein